MSKLKIDLVLSLILKILIYTCVQQNGYEETIKQQPFFTTKFHNFDRINEAHYLIDRNIDPYEMEHIFQKPLLVYLFYYIRSIPILKPVLFFIADIVIAEVISSNIFLHKRNNEQTLERDNMKRLFRFIYLYNPISFCALLTHWTSIFDLAFGLLAISLFYNNKLNLSALSFGFSLYLNPVNIMLALPIIIAQEYKNSNIKGRQYLEFLIKNIVAITVLILLSAKLTGSYKFLHQCYCRAYHVDLYQPSLNFIWALFSGMFTRYQIFYHAVFTIIPIFFIYPLKKIFGKVIRKEQWEYENGLIGFFTGFALFIGYLYFSFVTIYEISLIITLFFMGYEYIYRVKVLIVLNYTALFMGGLTSCLTALWFYGLTGNPNYNFFQITVMHIFSIGTLTESLKEYSKSIQIEDKLEDKQVSKQKIE